MSDPISRRIKKPVMNVQKSSLECHVCREEVNEGNYNFDTKTLRYWCSQGHESKVEDMKI